MGRLQRITAITTSGTWTGLEVVSSDGGEQEQAATANVCPPWQATLLLVTGTAAVGQTAPRGPVPVTADNFVRAETDLYFGHTFAEAHGIGRFFHHRTPMEIDKQTVIRANRDTLYSTAVVDLDAGPVTITLLQADDRFRSMIVITEDHYVIDTRYDAGSYSYDRNRVGTRYAMIGVRTLVDSQDPADVEAIHGLQDAMSIKQPGGSGTFEVPKWDKASQDRIRSALLVLAASLPDTHGMFGTAEEVDPIRHLIGSASAWGGNPEKDAFYLNVTPTRNDGETIYRLIVPADVPVDGFWSISRYNAEGYFVPNDLNAYSLNNITAMPEADGSITVQFGGCDDKVANCLPIDPGWNYMVRLYRPHPEILDGRWTFPEAQPAE